MPGHELKCLTGWAEGTHFTAVTAIKELISGSHDAEQMTNLNQGLGVSAKHDSQNIPFYRPNIQILPVSNSVNFLLFTVLSALRLEKLSEIYYTVHLLMSLMNINVLAWYLTFCVQNKVPTLPPGNLGFQFMNAPFSRT